MEIFKSTLTKSNLEDLQSIYLKRRESFNRMPAHPEPKIKFTSTIMFCDVCWLTFNDLIQAFLNQRVHIVQSKLNAEEKHTEELKEVAV